MMKKTPRGQSGNAGRYVGIVDRQWASNSYSATDGRAASSLGVDQSGSSPVGSKVGTNLNRQIPSGFEARDARCTQNAMPVRKRPFTTQVD